MLMWCGTYLPLKKMQLYYHQAFSKKKLELRVTERKLVAENRVISISSKKIGRTPPPFDDRQSE